MRALILVPAVLLTLPALAVEGAASAEITVGTGKQVGVNLTGELSPIEDRLWLVLGYSLFKSPDLEATDTTAPVKTAPSHLFLGGVDFSPHRQWILSVMAQGSPKASETVTLDLAGLPRIALGTVRQSAGASGLLIFDSAGTSAFEFSVDAGASFTWNLLGRSLTIGLLPPEQRAENLFVTRPVLGAGVVIKEDTTLSVRAGYTFYGTTSGTCTLSDQGVPVVVPAGSFRKADPLTVGRLNDCELQRIGARLADAALRLSTTVELDQARLNTLLSSQASFDAVSGYPYAPVWFDLKLSAQHAFGRYFTGQVSWTYLRYVQGQGFSNVAALKATVKFSRNWRVWLAGAFQVDEPTDTPSVPSYAGHFSLGAEFQF